MSTEMGSLALRLRGPLQAWGFDSQYNRRNTGLMPTRSAIIGMCCAAMGLPRGSQAEMETLTAFLDARFLVVSVPVLNHRSHELQVRRIQDYHTVQGTKTAEGKIKDTHLTHRQYLCDADFVVVISGSCHFLAKVSSALDNPVWGVWLGRKACIPTAPVLVASATESKLFDSESAALSVLLQGKPLDAFTCQRDVDNFADGEDSLPDVPLSFDTTARKFSVRRVKVSRPKKQGDSLDYFNE